MQINWQQSYGGSEAEEAYGIAKTESGFVDAGWSFGTSNNAPWIMATAPDNKYRPVLYYHNYSIHFVAGEGGLVTPEYLLFQTINCGSNAEAVQAIANEGYVFVKWQSTAGDSITNSNPLLLETLTSDSTLVAIFVSTEAVNENLAKLIKIYPNPASNQIFISTHDDIHILLINIYNQNGKLVISETNNINVINISTFESGIYIIELVLGKEVIRQKLIVR